MGKSLDGQPQTTGRLNLEWQALWQIYLPIVGGSLLIIALLLWVLLEAHPAISSVSNLSIALLALPLLFLGLIGTALIFALLFGVGWLLIKVPPYASLLQEWAGRGLRIVHGVANGIATPLILGKTGLQSVRGMLRALTSKSPFGGED